MKSSRLDRNEYGQAYRTNFELAQNGTSARLLDEIHYYTSCVLNKGSAARIKGDALEALIDIYACNFDQHTGSMLMSSLGSVMDVLCVLMTHDHETDLELIHKALVLLMALCSNHDGSFIEAIILPDTIVDYLLFGGITLPGSRRASANDCEAEMDGSTRGQIENPATAAAAAPKYHRKRKYISTRTLSESSLAAPDVLEREKTVVPSVTDPPSSREHRPVAASTGLYSCRRHFSALYDAFWRCSSCGAKNSSSSSDNHLLAETGFLRLLLLNRYIATKIHCLTSIQTSYFSSDPNSSGVGEGSAPADDTATSRYYRRQSDCVAALQRKMSTADPHRPGSSQTYLHSLCLHLQRETSGAMRDRPPDLGSCPCLSRCCRGAVWLIMGLLEAACFRCPSNQRLIASTGLSLQGAVNAPTPSCIGLLTAILVSSTPRWTNSEGPASFNEPTVDPTAMVDRSPHSAVLSVSPSGKSVSPSPLACPSGQSSAGMMGERERRALQAKRAANLFAELPQQSSEPSTDKDCVPPIDSDAPDAAAPATTLLMVIGLQEVQIAALKSLISISNNCEEACTAALREPGLLTWSVAMLAWCATWRCVLSTGSSSRCSSTAITGQPLGALTPNETPLERFVFDMTLYVQSLLTNILEHEQPTSSQSINVLDCLKECPSVKTAFHPGVHPIPVALSGRLPLLQQVLAFPRSSSSSCSMSDESSSLVELLIEIVLLETADFIEDIDRTDEAINLPREVGAEGLSRRVSDASTSPPSQKSSDEVQQESDALPVAALIVASYASLLLHTVVSASPSRSPMEWVRSRLPRGSWWLCIRVLKAFLALQGQTGVVLLENIGPVMQTLRRMGEQSEGLVGRVADEMSCSAGGHQEVSTLPPSIVNSGGQWSEEEAAVDCGQHRVAEENWLDDWRQLPHDAVICTRRSTSHDEMKRSSEAVEEEGKWVWNGGDFVWICGRLDDSTNTTRHQAFAAAAIDDIAACIDVDSDRALTTHAPESLGDDLVVLRRRKRIARL